MIFTSLDGDSEQVAHARLVWMPSHTSAATASRHRRSDGKPVSGTDWRANRLADALAKLAALSNQAPADLKRFLLAAKHLVEHSTAVLGVATHAANNFQESCWTDAGRLVLATRRDAAPPALNKGSWGPRTAPPTADATGPQPPPPPDSAAAARAAARDEAERHLTEQRDHRLAARGRAAQRRHADEAQAELRFRTAWHADLRERQLQPADGPCAADRLAALRERLRQRAAS